MTDNICFVLPLVPLRGRATSEATDFLPSWRLTRVPFVSVPRPGAEPHLPSHAAAHRGADLQGVQRGGHGRAAPRERRPEQRLPPL